MTEFVLHQWEMSPFCNKARRLLRLKGIGFRTVNYNGLLATKAAKLSTQGTLPVLDTGSARIVDSAAIAEWLDQQYPEPALYPGDAVARAEALIWEDWAGKTLYGFEIYFRMLQPVPLQKALDLICTGRPRWERVLLGIVFRQRYPRKMYWEGLGRLTSDEAENRFFAHLDNIETILGSRPWLVGARLSIADIAVAAQLDEILRTSEISDRIRSQYPRIMDWLQRQGPLEERV